jgi:hypothetical protein
MRLPPSVLVMSALVAVPFGLAIRDTLAGRSQADELSFFLAREDREREARARAFEDELRREAEQVAAARARRLAQLDELYGPTPASLGALFDGIALGMPIGEDPEATFRRPFRQAEGWAELDFGGDGLLTSIAIALEAVDLDDGQDEEPDRLAEACVRLELKLAAAWGPPSLDTWIDPALRQRARFDRDDCVLAFDRFQTPEEWVAAFPLDAVGKPAHQLLARLGSEVLLDERSESAGGGDHAGSAGGAGGRAPRGVDEHLASWTSPGLGLAFGATEVAVEIERGRVVGAYAEVATDHESLLAVRDAISASLKVQPVHEPATEAWRWKTRKGPLTLERQGDELRLFTGTER